MELAEDNATCGFYAALSILPWEEFVQFWDAHVSSELGAEVALTVEDILADIQGIGLSCGLATFEVIPAADGLTQIAVLRVIHQSEVTPGRMLVYTPVDGMGRPNPHWLSCTSFHRRVAVHLVDPVVVQQRDAQLALLVAAELAWAGAVADLILAERPVDPLLEELERLGGLVDAAEDIRHARPAPPPPDPFLLELEEMGGILEAAEEIRLAPERRPVLPRDRPPTAQRTHLHADRGVYMCVGVHCYPFPASTDLVTHRRWYRIGSLSSATANALVVDGAPGPIARAFPGAKRAPIYWELHPRVLLAGMHLREWHKVYVLMGPVSATDDRYLTTGCINPAVITALDCGVIVYDLVDPVTIPLPNGHMLLFSLSIRLCSLLGATSISLPIVKRFVQHKVLQVQRRALPDCMFGMPSEADFPDRRAYIRTVFEHFFRTAPQELKASVERQLREVLAALEAGTLAADFDFLRLMRALQQCRDFSCRFFGGPGMAVQC